jgi:hypothetical protein
MTGCKTPSSETARICLDESGAAEVAQCNIVGGIWIEGSFLKMLTRDIFLKYVIFEKKRSLRVIEDEGGVSSLKVGELDSITGSVSTGDLILEEEVPLLRRKVSLVLSVLLINILSTSLMLMLERGPRSSGGRNKQQIVAYSFGSKKICIQIGAAST